MFLYKNFFFNIFCYFNPNHAYWNQRRLFSGNLPGMFSYCEVENFFNFVFFSRFLYDLFINEVKKLEVAVSNPIVEDIHVSLSLSLSFC